ncbi:ExeM/NucH family extracellular endonuclease [Roseateles sp.]|uniref:ExeM/NucH family extracellular endonuclease n=1 Tax=Roseateles sp. TaxID=1971397 RepID=UPI003BAA6FED
MQIKPLVSLLAALFAAPAVLASTSGIVISQVYGGGGNSGATYKQDFIELFNAGSAAVNIGGWSVQYAAAAGTSWQTTAIPAGTTLQPGQYYLVREAAGTGGTVDVPGDLLTGSINMSGTTGKVALVKSTTALSGAAPAAEDVISWGPSATPTEGAVAAVLTNTTAHLRAANGCTDTDNNAADFAAGTPAPRNATSPLNVCGGGTPVNQPIVPSCPDSSAASGVPSSFTVTAVDADSKVTSATKIESPTAWPTGITLGTFTPSSDKGVAASQAIQVSGSLPAGSYTLNLKWDNDDAQTASCTFKVSVAGTVTIPAIQGSGARSPMEGQTVTTSGVVTKVTNAGFFMQDPVGDGDPATSDGIYVFTSTAPTVVEGQLVRLSATVTEYNTGAANNAASLAAPLTELTNVTGITVLGSGYQIQPADVNLATLPAGGLEAYEGMLVRIRGPLTVQQNYFLGRYGQLTVSAGGRAYTPTHVYRPGADALALQAENARRSFLLDDGSTLQNVNPTPYIGADNTVRAGDTLDEVTGVIDFGLATATTTGAVMYRLQPTVAPVIARSNPRDAAPPVSGGNVRIASANVLNFFTTFTDGSNYLGQSGQGCTLGSATSASNCRGADSLLEFQRQRAKIVANLSGLNADVVGLMEIQNNGNVAVQHLVDSLNAVMGANTYAVVPAPAQGTGTDAIRVAMIYKPGKLTLNGVSIADPAAINNRPPFAQSFATPNGSKFAVIVNHLKSKGSCPTSGADTDDGLQGCWNATRTQQIAQLKTFLAQVQASTSTPDVILLGDFNAHQKEDPIDALLSGGAIVDAVSSFDPLDWSYIFDGGSGRLDHGFVTASLAPKLAFATSWHINADEPTIIDYNLEFKQPACATCGPDYYTPTAFRSSDHDPMLMGLNLFKSLKGTDGADTIVGTPGDDIIEGGLGRDTLTGNGGRDQFVYRTGADGLDTITDFKPGIDLLVFTDLLRNVGITSGAPLTTGHVTCTQQADGGLIGYDPDGAAGPAASRPVVKLKNVSCTAVNASSFKF